MKKKLLSCILSMVMLVSLFTGMEFPALATEAATLSISNAAAYPGDTVVVDVSLSGVMSGMQITLGYDPAVLTPEKIERGPECPSGLMVATSNNLSMGRFVAVSSTPINETINGVIARYTYKVNPDAALGKSSLNVTKSIMSDAGTDYIATVSSHGSVTVVDESLSTDATLSGLTISSGTLSPTFSSNETAYTVSVPYSVNSITVTAVPNHIGAKVTSGNGAHALTVGANLIPILVTAENGVSTKTYVLTVTREDDSSDPGQADLDSLTISRGTLTPTFSAGVTSYTASVPNNVSSINIAATAVSGATVSGDTGTKTLAVGANTFTITVTAGGGATTKNYVIVVTRADDPGNPGQADLENLAISSGTLTPAFNTSVTSYTASVPNNVSSINITATAVSGATVSGDTGTKTLAVGANTFTITVTAGGGATKDYVIVVTRADKKPFPFTDVKESDWFYNDVYYMWENELMNGTAATLFSPNTNLKRGMVVTVLYRMEKEPGVAALSNPFNDVAASQYYTNAVKWAADNKIVLGYGDGTFRPERDVTREELAAILYRYEQYSEKIPPNTVEDKTFADAGSISGYAKESVKALVMQGIINGKQNNRFDPKANATRAEYSAMLHRYLVAID